MHIKTKYSLAAKAYNVDIKAVKLHRINKNLLIYENKD